MFRCIGIILVVAIGSPLFLVEVKVLIWYIDIATQLDKALLRRNALLLFGKNASPTLCFSLRSQRLRSGKWSSAFFGVQLCCAPFYFAGGQRDGEDRDSFLCGFPRILDDLKKPHLIEAECP